MAFYAKCHVVLKPRMQCILSSRCRAIAASYHTKTGVYGFQPSSPRSFNLDESVIKARIENSNVYRLIESYRSHGHKQAALDPLKLKHQRSAPELDPQLFGLDLSNSSTIDASKLLHSATSSMTSAELVQKLEHMYCGHLTAEYQHLLTVEEREWFTENYERLFDVELTNSEKIKNAQLMLKSQGFDNFLANKFTTVKRYGGEGAESAMCFYEELFRQAAKAGIKDVMIGIAHRGRLNLLTCLLKYPAVNMFRKMKGKREFPGDVLGAGDVLSHLTSSVDLQYDNHSVHVTMLPNPSHLEVINPVAVGKVRGREQTHKTGDYKPPGSSASEGGEVGDSALCFQIHGDAAFTGQGVVAETFALADVPHYSVGGSIHIILNNQIGFTAESKTGRSSPYSSDVAKMNGCPIIHVNADYPEEVVKACRLAVAYRQCFKKDILVDYVCYRRWGHNEMDDPSFTQPLMYNAISDRASIPNNYAAQLVRSGITTEAELNAPLDAFNQELSGDMSQIDKHVPQVNHLTHNWSGYKQASPSIISTWDTGVGVDLLKYVGAKSVTVPDAMAVHPTLKRTHIDRRLDKLQEGVGLDWATAEALAIGSLLHQGYNVRISGQDVGRGTFSHRHAMLVDQTTDEMYIPLNHITPTQTGFFEIANSLLSEEAVLAFEYGMSIENPTSLVIWEAQFGDFHNGAQIVIDTCVTGGESKWLTQSGLVMLLPHGMDGTGPEHSSCRIERFLQLCDSREDRVDSDDINCHIVNPTTPAQYFHLLRRQMVRNYRKPLIVVAPKTLLRAPTCQSGLHEMSEGTTFQSVLSDPRPSDPQSVTRVVFVSGKHYYTLDKAIQDTNRTDTVVVRLEELCPFPAEGIQQQLQKYPNARDFVWSQEEHRNQGAWSFVAPRFENVCGVKLRYAGRDVLGIPAVGVGEVHKAEAAQIIADTFR